MAPFSFPPTPQDWTQIQDAVRAYYVREKLPLKEVRIVLRDKHGFRATDRMIKARLKQWGYLKNAKKEDWHFLALLHHRRKDDGKQSTEFDVRGHRKTVKDLQRFIRNQNMTTDQFLEEARQSTGDKVVPDYIRALSPEDNQYQFSPTLDDAASPDNYYTPSPPHIPAHGQINNARNVSDVSQYLHPEAHFSHSRKRSASFSPMGRERSGPHSQIPQSLQPPIDLQNSTYMSASSTSSTCTQMQMEFEMLGSQITRPSPLLSRFGDEDISSWALLSSSPSNSDNSGYSTSFVCSRCNQPSDQHFISLDNFEPHRAARRDILNGDDHTLHLPVSTKDEGSWLWVSRCFLACMCLRKGDEAAAELSLHEAANEFERLLDRKDSQLLTAAGLVMTILHQHDQGSIAKKVIESAYDVCKRVLSEDHAIYMTFRYLTASATISQSEWGITSDYTKTIVKKFLELLPRKHEYVMAARHNYSWMLKFENRLDEAEAEAREVHKISQEVLGKIHMQTVTSLAVIAGCLYSNHDRRMECISLFKDIVKQAGRSLGRHHPYTLEAKRRLALVIIEDSGPSAETLKLFKEIVWGRVHMLGSTHPYTIGARTNYEEQLQEAGLWLDSRGALSPQARDLEELFSPSSPGSWTRITRRRTSSQQTIPRPGSMEFDPKISYDEGEDMIIVDGRSGSQSPRSVQGFEAY